VSIQKRGILLKVKSQIPDFERDAVCPAIAFGDGGRLGKRTVYGWTLGGCPGIAIFSKIEECPKKLPQAYS